MNRKQRIQWAEKQPWTVYVYQFDTGCLHIGQNKQRYNYRHSLNSRSATGQHRDRLIEARGYYLYAGSEADCKRIEWEAIYYASQRVGDMQGCGLDRDSPLLNINGWKKPRPDPPEKVKRMLDSLLEGWFDGTYPKQVVSCYVPPAIADVIDVRRRLKLPFDYIHHATQKGGRGHDTTLKEDVKPRIIRLTKDYWIGLAVMQYINQTMCGPVPALYSEITGCWRVPTEYEHLSIPTKITDLHYQNLPDMYRLSKAAILKCKHEWQAIYDSLRKDKSEGVDVLDVDIKRAGIRLGNLERKLRSPLKE